jgi:hypothetical protein
MSLTRTTPKQSRRNNMPYSAIDNRRIQKGLSIREQHGPITYGQPAAPRKKNPNRLAMGVGAVALAGVALFTGDKVVDAVFPDPAQPFETQPGPAEQQEPTAFQKFIQGENPNK